MKQLFKILDSGMASRRDSVWSCNLLLKSLVVLEVPWVSLKLVLPDKSSMASMVLCNLFHSISNNSLLKLNFAQTTEVDAPLSVVESMDLSPPVLAM